MKWEGNRESDNVEDARGSAHGVHLVDHARVLDGHLPTGERHHPRAERDMTGIQGCAPESFVAHTGDSSAVG